MDILDALLPGNGGLDLNAVEMDSAREALTLYLKSKRVSARCPLCQRVSTGQHSRDVRTLADLPWAQFSLIIKLDVGKWCCVNEHCVRRVFAERSPAIAAPWARRTNRLAQRQVSLGLTVGGRPGQQLSGHFRIVTSRETLLRLVRRAPLSGRATPRILGIDDWAKRKGQSYGTVLVDLESHKIVDLLPERSAVAIAQWLKAHPGVEIITRDRAGDYAAGASAGAPDALQVADRWHLLKNLVDVLLDALKPHRKTLRDLSIEETGDLTDPGAMVSTSAQEPPVREIDTARARKRQQRHARRSARYERVVARRQQGWTQKAIAIEFGMSSKTVSRWLAKGEAPTLLQRSKRRKLLEPYMPDLLDRWQAGCRNGAPLRREIQSRGYRGGQTIVNDLLSRLRQAQGLPPRSHAVSAASLRLSELRHPLTPRRLAGIVFKPPAARTEAQQSIRLRVTETLPTLQPILILVAAFADMVRTRQGERLVLWLEQAAKLETFRGFVAGIRRDFAAVYAAMTTEWRNGPVEGKINRLKFIKRQGYGRASFDLRRKRVLLSGA